MRISNILVPGSRHGLLTLVGKGAKNSHGAYKYWFQCGCGNTTLAYPHNILHKGHCGCRDKTLEERLVAFLVLNPQTDCWEFDGYLNNRGYGHMGYGKGLQYAHRVAWLVWKGEIPEGLCVLHRCDNPPCCNPNHLLVGTFRDNLYDARAKGRWWGRRKLSELNHEKQRLGL